MSAARKPAQAREKELRLAMFRIERGRSLTKETNLSIASVAREAGVSTALIHNYYPGIADAIRQAKGRSNRMQRDAKNLELKEEKRNAKALRQEVASLRADVAKLSSINEVLAADNAALRAKLNDPKVVEFVSRPLTGAETRMNGEDLSARS